MPIPAVVDLDLCSNHAGIDTHHDTGLEGAVTAALTLHQCPEASHIPTHLKLLQLP